jgi:hypothetical protein
MATVGFNALCHEQERRPRAAVHGDACTVARRTQTLEKRCEIPTAPGSQLKDFTVARRRERRRAATTSKDTARALCSATTAHLLRQTATTTTS